MAVRGGSLAYLYDNVTTNLRDPEHPDRLRLPRSPGHASRSPTRTSGPASRCATPSPVGVKNTLVVAAVGIVLTLVRRDRRGRRSPVDQLLVRTAAGLYVEILRNIPPLLIIVFANAAIFLQLPVITDPFELGGLLLLSNRELAVASPVLGDRFGVYLVLLVRGGRGRGGRLGGAHPSVGGDGTTAPPRARRRRDRGPGRGGRLPRARRADRAVHPEVDGRGSPAGVDHEHRLRRSRDRPRALHVEPRRRDRAGRDPGGRPRPDRGGRRARPLELAAAPLRRAPAGVPHRGPADDQPVPQPHEEQLPGHRGRLRRAVGPHPRRSSRRRTRPRRWS